MSIPGIAYRRHHQFTNKSFDFAKERLHSLIKRYFIIIQIKAWYTLPVPTSHVHGPWTRASFWTPVFTGRVHGPRTRVVSTELKNQWALA